MMEITYYGHSCFKVEKDGCNVVFDPYQKGSVPGVELPEDLEADYVICSHEHGDHNARERVTLKKGGKPFFTEKRIRVPHDDADGAKRGMNNIAILDCGTLRVVHFGDIGRECTEEEYKDLEGSDVVMIPCGGFYTIDAVQAKAICDRIRPRLTILMHYRRGKAGYDVLADIEDVVKTFGNVRRYAKKITFTEEDMPHTVCMMEV